MKLLCKVTSVSFYVKADKKLIYCTFKDLISGKTVGARLEDRVFPLELLEEIVIITLGSHLGEFGRREFNGSTTQIPRYDLLDIEKFEFSQYASDSSRENWSE